MKICLLEKALSCAINQRALRRTLFFFTSLHCFIVSKTSMNAAVPAECCISTTVQLVMYYIPTELVIVVVVVDLFNIKMCFVCT